MIAINPAALFHLQLMNPDRCTIEHIHTDETYLAASAYTAQSLIEISESHNPAIEQIIILKHLLKALNLKRSQSADSDPVTSTPTTPHREVLRRILELVNPNEPELTKALPAIAPRLVEELTALGVIPVKIPLEP